MGKYILKATWKRLKIWVDHKIRINRWFTCRLSPTVEKRNIILSALNSYRFGLQNEIRLCMNTIISFRYPAKDCWTVASSKENDHIAQNVFFKLLFQISVSFKNLFLLIHLIINNVLNLNFISLYVGIIWRRHLEK